MTSSCQLLAPIRSRCCFCTDYSLTIRDVLTSVPSTICHNTAYKQQKRPIVSLHVLAALFTEKQNMFIFFIFAERSLIFTNFSTQTANHAVHASFWNDDFHGNVFIIYLSNTHLYLHNIDMEKL